jgi:hypothetical protein
MINEELESISMDIYLLKGSPPELCKECFPDAYTPRLFLDKQVFKLCYANIISEMYVMRPLAA